MAYLGSPKATLEVINKYGFAFQKRFGQNFLIDTHVLDKIISAAGITKDDFVLEIGPGIGTMTQYLACAAREVVAIEIDKNLIPILEDTLQDYENVSVINDDILKVDIAALAEEKNQGRPIKVVANLPYYITTPIIMKLLEDRLKIESITVMVQKEVADRIVEKPGDKESGAITYSVYYYSYPRKICFVSKECFIPSPEVDSEVIQLQIRKEPIVKVKDEEMFFKVIKASFMQRRKTLLNGLINGGLISNKDEGKNILTKLEIPENIRGEKLTTEQFAQIADEIYTKINK